MQDTNLTKQCPFCAETILAAAIKCKHCGSMLSASEAKSVVASPQPVPISQVPPSPSAATSFSISESTEKSEQIDLLPSHSRLKVGAIIRDVLIVWGLTAIGGFIAGVAGNKDATSPIALGISNILLGTVAFAIVGCLAGRKRWRHLGIVALLAWLSGLVNILFGVTFLHWLFGSIVMAAIMGLGGGISHLIRPDSSSIYSPQNSNSSSAQCTHAISKENKSRWYARLWFVCGMIVVAVIYWFGSCIYIEKHWKGIINVPLMECIGSLLVSILIPLGAASVLWIPVLIVLSGLKINRGYIAFKFIVITSLILVVLELSGVSTVLSYISFGKPDCSPWEIIK